MIVYVDTGVLLANIISNDPNHTKAKLLLESLSKHRLLVSELNVVEMFSVLSRNIDLLEIEDFELKENRDILITAIVILAIEKSSVELVSIRKRAKYYYLGNKKLLLDPIIQYAINLSTKIKLKTLDLLHISYAKHLNANAFLTLDKDIIKKSKLIEKETKIRIISDRILNQKE